ncbi:MULTISPECIES: succinate dehydrogenase, cytochrome b556 subunit [Cysteiniphilum]|uniref:Succinate dehydrogenase cytochrome b556 subunit n=1 Tax=Cysteiniphilum litorale TaxID=2056700 RepID=A0A8J2Z5F7_9GAMM|nr:MULTISPECIES: succinate dehydrogenase, cytochrome b556 subunit [Cysteiniphilum]GGG02350.1 succinate dehydrogenase, cytochrome b556 subunit [Cysteiniphilum litorale]
MKHQGPRNIGLGSIKSYSFPITAISSIIHRITGVLMVVLLPFLIWGFSLSMRCGGDFYYVQDLLIHSPWSIVAWIFISAVSYHVIAGIRHLIMDLGFGEEMCVARASSIAVLVLGVLVTIFWGLWLWVM